MGSSTRANLLDAGDRIGLSREFLDKLISTGIWKTTLNFKLETLLEKLLLLSAQRAFVDNQRDLTLDDITFTLDDLNCGISRRLYDPFLETLNPHHVPKFTRHLKTSVKIARSQDKSRVIKEPTSKTTETGSPSQASKSSTLQDQASKLPESEIQVQASQVPVQTSPRQVRTRSRSASSCQKQVQTCSDPESSEAEQAHTSSQPVSKLTSSSAQVQAAFSSDDYTSRSPSPQPKVKKPNKQGGRIIHGVPLPKKDYRHKKSKDPPFKKKISTPLSTSRPRTRSQSKLPANPDVVPVTSPTPSSSSSAKSHITVSSTEDLSFRPTPRIIPMPSSRNLIVRKFATISHQSRPRPST